MPLAGNRPFETKETDLAAERHSPRKRQTANDLIYAFASSQSIVSGIQALLVTPQDKVSRMIGHDQPSATASLQGSNLISVPLLAATWNSAPSKLMIE
jgi:hypothetical protein